jgi:hypothetical protein
MCSEERRWTPFENGSDGEDSGRKDFIVGVLDRLGEVLGSIVDARNDVRIVLGIGSPEDDNGIETIVLLEVANV